MGTSKIIPIAVEHDGRMAGEWRRRVPKTGYLSQCRADGEINDANVRARVQAYVDSQRDGGCNAHLVRDGKPDAPKVVRIIVQTGAKAGTEHNFRVECNGFDVTNVEFFIKLGRR